MKKQEKYILPIISVLSIVLVIFLLNKFKKNTDLVCDQVKENNELLTTILSTNLISSNSAVGFKFESNIYVEDEDFNKWKLANIISDNMLIFRISESHCGACDQSGLNSLLNNKQEIQNKNIIILCSFFNTRHLKEYRKKHKIPYRMYNLKKSINFNIEDLNFPYFLIVNRDLEVVSCFLPDKHFVSFTDDYFYGVRHLLNAEK